MHAFPRFLIAAIMLGILPAIAAAGAQLPVRKSGYWQITTVADTVGMKTFQACITAADPIVTGIGEKACKASEVKMIGDERYVTVTCGTAEGKETTSTVLTGDFTTWYRAMSKISFDPPQNGIAHLGATIEGKFLSPSCPKTGAQTSDH